MLRSLNLQPQCNDLHTQRTCCAEYGGPPLEGQVGRPGEEEAMAREKGGGADAGRGASCRAIAAELGRAPSTVKREVDRHRFVTAHRSMRGEPVPEGLAGACPRLGAWPRCCNGCGHRRGYGCSRKPRVSYDARLAQAAADAELSGSRRGIDETEATAAAKLSAIRDGLVRGLSPEQVAASSLGFGLTASTVYRWVDAGYAGMTNLDLRRKVGYKRRRRKAAGGPTRHSGRRSHTAFLALGEDARAAAWEMDTVEGRAADSTCLLTLLHRPSRFQLALPMREKACAETLRCLGLVRAQPRRTPQDTPQGEGPAVRPPRAGRPRARHVARQLRTEGRPRVPQAGRRPARRVRRRRPGAHGRPRRRGAAGRFARPDPALRRVGACREG